MDNFKIIAQGDNSFWAMWEDGNDKYSVLYTAAGVTDGTIYKVGSKVTRNMNAKANIAIREALAERVTVEALKDALQVSRDAEEDRSTALMVRQSDNLRTALNEAFWTKDAGAAIDLFLEAATHSDLHTLYKVAFAAAGK